MILAFTGKMGAGKSTAAKQLEKLGYYVTVSKFAAPLYDIQELIYRRIESVVRRDHTFEKDRKLLQLLGTEWGRSLDEDLWVKLWKQDVQQLENRLKDKPNHVIVVDDCRFDNEAQAVLDKGGYIVNIRCDGVAHTTRSVHGRDSLTHASERGISNRFVLATLENSGTVEELKENLKNIMKLIEKEIK